MADDRAPQGWKPDRDSATSAQPGSANQMRTLGSDAVAEFSRRDDVPLYPPTALEFVEMPDRDACWQLLNRSLRERLSSRPGRILEWWAILTTVGWPRAVVLGDQALVMAEPTYKDNGELAMRVRTLALDAASFRQLEVVEEAASPAAPGRWLQQTSPHPMRLGLGSGIIHLLGNLPIRAQTYLQQPFVHDLDGLIYDHYYWRNFSDSNEELFVACYLANQTQVTFVSGIRRAPISAAGGGPTWRLTCRMVACRQAGTA